MIKITLSLFFIGHFLGDFYFQSNNLAKTKEQSFNKLITHSVIYYLAMILVTLPIFSLSILMWANLIAIIHFGVDWLKYYIKTNINLNTKGETRLYFIDQLIHILTIFIIVLTMNLLSTTAQYSDFFNTMIVGLEVNVEFIILWLLAILITIKPVSITTKKILSSYQPTTVAKEEFGHPGAGALIGILERLLILLMLAQNQYAAIGFVLTAKSIARYNKIVENPQFSEYYLLGTLLSMLLVIATYILIIQ